MERRESDCDADHSDNSGLCDTVDIKMAQRNSIYSVNRKHWIGSQNDAIYSAFRCCGVTPLRVSLLRFLSRLNSRAMS